VNNYRMQPEGLL